LLESNETQTVLTRAFDVAQGLAWPAEFPGRGLRNSFTDRWGVREEQIHNDPETPSIYLEAMKRNDYSVAHIYAGQAVGMMHRSRPAGEIIRELSEGAERLLQERFRTLLGLS
jgi:nitronate monooxygenase